MAKRSVCTQVKFLIRQLESLPLLNDLIIHRNILHFQIYIRKGDGYRQVGSVICIIGFCLVKILVLLKYQVIVSSRNIAISRNVKFQIVNSCITGRQWAGTIGGGKYK